MADMTGKGPSEALYALYAPNVNHSERFQAALNTLSPLVKLDHIKAHLVLIGAFREALEKVDKFTGSFELTDALCSYLSRGVHRLHAWLTYVISTSADRSTVQPQELPPLDVLLLFHAYLLRPHRFYEASITTYPQLFAMGPFPLLQVVCCNLNLHILHSHFFAQAALIHPDTLESQPKNRSFTGNNALVFPSILLCTNMKLRMSKSPAQSARLFSESLGRTEGGDTESGRSQIFVLHADQR